MCAVHTSTHSAATSLLLWIGGSQNTVKGKGAKPTTVSAVVMQHSRGFCMPQQPAGITVMGHVALRSLPM
jgi:hypothetical protein